MHKMFYLFKRLVDSCLKNALKFELFFHKEIEDRDQRMDLLNNE